MPPPLTRFPKDVGVNTQIERDNEEPDYELDVSRERGGIEDRKNVMFDETARVTSATRLSAQRVFERRQRADPARELDGGAPDCTGNVQVGQLRPPQYQQPTEDDEHHEEEVNSDDKICEKRRQEKPRRSFVEPALSNAKGSG